MSPNRLESAAEKTAGKLRCEPLRPDQWSDIEALFGSNGACGGCWCMYWRQEKGEPWDQVKGMEARRRFRALVESGKARGVLAFEGVEPVGWLAIGKRPEFVKLNRAPSLKCDDAERVHSLPCFFVRSGFRKRGVARALLRAAVKFLRAEGAEILEGYPVRTLPEGGAHPAAFAYTGTESLFASEGFVPADDRTTGKQRARKLLGRRARSVAP